MKGILKRGKAIPRVLVAAAGLTMCLTTASYSADWQITVVDSAGVGKFSSLKIDKDGNAHLAFVVEDGNVYPLKYGFWDHALKRWFVMIVDQGASFCSLVLDSKQRPHISYADYGTGSGAKLRYAYWDGTSWNKKAVPINADVIGYYTSIALDAKDNPSISFYEYRGPRGSDFRIRLRSVMWNGQYWEARTVDSEEGSGKFNSMAIDAKGELHLAYGNVGSSGAGMRYARWDGQSWKSEVVEGLQENNGETVGYSACIALDNDGNPHVSYMNQSVFRVKYAVRKNGRWQIETVDQLAGAAYPDRNSITLDENGRPYISYYDAGRRVLKLAYRQGQNWAAEIVDSDAAGFTSSVQIYRNTVWISYADEGSGALKVARAELPHPNTAAPSQLSQASK